MRQLGVSFALFLAVALLSPMAFANIANDMTTFQEAWTKVVKQTVVNTNDPQSMIQVYGQTLYPDFQDRIRYILHAEVIEIGSDKIATLKPVVGVAAIVNAVRRSNANSDADSQINGEQIRTSLRALISEGVIFGFDGHAENDCGAPTIKLLMLDPTAGTVYSMDLENCDG